MARIRTIKPEITQSESLGRVSREARLCFILLWTQADDGGRLRANSRLLASLLYPYDADASKRIDGWLEELEAEGCIRRYAVDGDHYLDIPKWLEHQKIDHAKESKFPSFDEASPVPREDSRSVANESARPRTKDQGPRNGSRTTLSGADAPRDEAFEKFWKAYPRRDGANPKKPAQDKFQRLVKFGVDPEVLAVAAKGYADQLGEKAGTQYVAQAVTWLNQERWRDYDVAAIVARRTAPAAWANGLAQVAARASPQLRLTLWKCRPVLSGDAMTLYAPTAFLRDELLSRHVADLKKLWPNVKVEMEAADAAGTS